MKPLMNRPGLAVLILTVVLAFAFQGSRGVWEPDEGFYLGAARQMVETGDWIVPQLNLRPFLDKPPMVYWSSAIPMSFFGFNEWAARLSNALWYVLTAGVVYLFGRSAWDRTTGLLAAAIYAISPVPFIAANVITPDTCFAFWVTAGVYCLWKGLTVPTCWTGFLWQVATGIVLGIAILSKGPATFVIAAPFFLFALLTGRTRRLFLSPGFWVGLVAFAAVGGSWYLLVISHIPGAASYFLDNQVFGRLVGNKYNRNPEWYAFLIVYFPVLLFGTLPGSLSWYPRLRQIARDRGEWRDLLRRPQDERNLLLFLWACIPLAIFSLASSRLPLYVLPLFAPLSLVSARCWITWNPKWVQTPLSLRRLSPWLVWCLLLITVKAGLASWPTKKDTRAFWEAVRDDLPAGRCELVVVDQHRHGLSFYSPQGVEEVTTDNTPYPTFTLPERLEHEIHELRTSSHHHVFLVRNREYAFTTSYLKDKGATFEEEEGPFETKVLTVQPAPQEDQVVRLAAMGDTRSGDSGQIQLGSALYHADEDQPLDGIVLLGDNISFRGEPEYYDDHFLKPYHALLRAGVGFYAILGNHDIKGGYESFQLNEPELNMNGRRYYTEEFGESLVQCFFLDSNTLVGDPNQRKWLIRELGKSDARWKMVAMHVPIYGGIERRPEADQSVRDLLEPIFVQGGVDIVVCGHNHVYQRFLPQKGIHHFTAGSGGELDRGQILRDDPYLAAGEDQMNVALLLEFNQARCEFEAINVLEEVVDRGFIPHESRDLQSAMAQEPGS